jgi:hypothetical protein
MIAITATGKTRAIGVLLGGSGRALEHDVKKPALPALLRPRQPDTHPSDQPCEYRAAA